MSAPTWDDLRDLMARSAPHCVSLFLPTHRSGRETGQDPLRLKNLLGRAEEELRALGLRGPDAGALLGPGRALLQDQAFWQQRQEGLALFFAPGWWRALSTPVVLGESLMVSGRFHVRPLLPALWPDLRFHVLALSRSGARLLTATRFTVAETELHDLPAGMDALLAAVESERQLQAHVAARRGSSRAGGAVAFHGHGLGRDASDERLLEYFRAVDRSVAAAVRADDAPLVLAAVEHFLPLYREVSAVATVIDAAVPGSPDELADAELHERAWALVAPLAERQTEERLARYAEHAAKGGAAHSIQGVLSGAQAARVETLFVPSDHAVWGRFDAAGGRARIHASRRRGDEDLLDRAVVETMRTGGTVVPLAQERLPGGGPLAAIMRY